MNIIANSSILFIVVLSFIIGTSFLVSDSYADHMTASVSTPQGTSVPGCEETNECFVPYEVTVDVGGEVTWSNDDTAAHTVTSGSAADGPSGVFDSSLFMAGTTFSHTFEAAGEFPYHCMVHPWMAGIVTVQEADTGGDNFVLTLKTIADKTITEGKTLSFSVSVTDSSLDGLTFSLEKNPPSGASINSSTGQFTWTPSPAQGSVNGIQYNFDIVVEKGIQKDSESITITVKDPITLPLEPLAIPAPFVDPNQDPQYYVDRYNNEPSYKKWFDDNFPEYDSIYQAVGLREPTPSGPPITVKTNSNHYKEGDIIYVSGQVSEILFGYAVSILVIGPDGNTIVIDQAIVDSKGNYQSQFTAGMGLMTEDGVYTVQVLYATENRTAETTFSFTGSTSSSQITLTTDKSYYYQGETIRVSGWVSNPSLAGSVTLLVMNPNNELISPESAKPDSSGFYQKNIVITGSNWNTEGWFSIEATFGTSKENTKFFVDSAHISEDPTTPPPAPSGGFASVSTPQGTSTPGCEETNECFIPYEVRVNVGGEVTWKNDDTAAHTVTSGSAADGPSGIFDSSLFMAGTTFSHTFESAGVYPYFCMVHPWMAGIVTVGQGGTTPPPSSINVKTDKTTYYIGDTLKITGVLQPADGSTVVLQIFNPRGTMVYNDSVSSFSSGLFSNEVRLTGSNFVETGTYTVKASANSVTDTTEFFLREEISSPPPSEDFASVSTPQGTSVPGCESTNECFIPYVVAIDVGGVVRWSNDDTAAHTVTSGSAADGPSGIFDSSLFMAGTTFSHTFTQSGTFDYFCMVHPWMAGIVLVGEGTIPKPDSPISLSISTNDSVYDLGEIVRIKIGVKDSSKAQIVAVSVTDPTGTSVISRSLSILPDESEVIEFRISEDFKTGSYRITATTSDDGKTVTQTAYFKIKSQFNSFKITNVEATDQQGNPSGLEAGRIGFIKVNLNSEKQIAALVTVNIFDSNLSSIGIGSVKTTLSSGNSEIILSFMIPENVSLGPAKIYVNAFSDWPSNGGIALTEEFAATEEIQ